MSDSGTPTPTTQAPPPRKASRSAAFRRRRREARDRMSALWTMVKTLPTRIAVVLTLVVGAVGGYLLYYFWFDSLVFAIILVGFVAARIFLDRQITGWYQRTRSDIRTYVEPRRKWVNTIGGITIAVLCGFIPFISTWFEVPDWVAQATNGAVMFKVALFALFALGLNVVVGFAGLLDLGYVAFWAIGAYTAGILTGAAQYSHGLNESPPTVTFADKPVWEPWMWLILPAALVVAVIAGLLLGSPTLRLRGDYLAIVTLGFGEIVRITANNLDSITVGPRGISSIPHPEITLPGGRKIEWGTLTDNKYYWLLLAFVFLWVVAIRMLDNSRIGRAWVAVREDEVAAAAMGVPVVRMKLAAFAIGACTAGVGGVVYAWQINSISPNQFQLIQSILILAMVVIGGMGSITGAIVGAALVTIIPEIFRGITDYRFLIFGVALIVVMIFRPQGLVPSKRRKAELRGGTSQEDLYDALHTG